MQERNEQLKQKLEQKLEEWKEAKLHETKVPRHIAEREIESIAKTIDLIVGRQMSDSELREVREEDWKTIDEVYEFLRCNASTRE